jgi:hypothetical protein
MSVPLGVPVDGHKVRILQRGHGAEPRHRAADVADEPPHLPLGREPAQTEADGCVGQLGRETERMQHIRRLQAGETRVRGPTGQTKPVKQCNRAYLADVHAEPELSAALSNDMSSDSPSTFSNERFTFPTQRSVGWPGSSEPRTNTHTYTHTHTHRSAGRAAGS